MTMKIFIRTSSLGEKAPHILASYPADSPITADSHGPEMTMLEVPNLGFSKAPNETFPRLPEDWRERLSESILEMEAKKRINDVLSPLEQMTTLHELINLIMRHGTDVSQWPDNAKTRKAEIDDAWNYVREIRTRAQAMRSLPPNPTSDQHWPTRIAKR
jgi:hypothetical protein